MKIKQIITSAFLLLCLCSTAFGQITKNPYATIEMGEEYSISRSGGIGSIVGYDKTGFYLYKYETKSFFRRENYLERYDNDLKRTNSEKLELPKNCSLVRITQLGEELYIFTEFLDKTAKEKTLFVQQIDKSTLKLKGTAKQIAQISFEGKSRFNSGSFGFSVARDTSKVLIYYDLPYEKNANEKFGFHVHSIRWMLVENKNVQVLSIRQSERKLYDLKFRHRFQKMK
ncbi:hypothetical protein [Bernardetia sp.]|uniref:hypothetical protein n=1 Tax=Bernardetia sp. TaxID=1937974 RepID=UPI0025C5D4CE|nr:hypothetical protein [Bernardetia sp.]